MMESNYSQNSSEETTGSDELKLVLIWTMTFISIIACVSNMLVIVTIFGTKTLRTISSVFLLNLTLCDFFIAIVMMPIMVNNVRNDSWVLSQDACIGIGLWNNLLRAGSIYTVTAISLDRYITIIHCLKYSSWSKYKYICIVLLLIWLMSLLLTFPTLSSDYGYMEYDTNRYMCLPNWTNRSKTVILASIFLYMLPIIVMTFCYLKIIGVARNHARKISNMTKQINKNITNRENNNSGVFGTEMVGSVHGISMISFPAGENNRPMDNGFVQIPHRIIERSLSRFEREARAAIRLVGLILSFVCCWTPYAVINCAIGYGYTAETLPRWSLPISMWLTVFHSAFNPFLYAIMSKRFRFAVKRLFSKWCHFVIGTKQIMNLSEVRSKCFETDNGIRTVSMFQVNRFRKMEPIAENKIVHDNKLILSSMDSEDVNLSNKSGRLATHKPRAHHQEESKINSKHQHVYLSVPRKTFTKNKGSVHIKTVTSDKGETIATSIIQVQGRNDNKTTTSVNNSQKNTKIRICVDLTT